MNEPRIVEATGIAGLPNRNHGLRRKFVDSLIRKCLCVAHSRMYPAALRAESLKIAMRLRPVMGGSMSNTLETALLGLLFTAVAIADLADDDQSTPATTLTFALHTGDPGEAGDQTTNESAYTSYARQTVARSGSGFTVTNNSVSPDANIDFPAATGGSETVTHFSVGSGVSNNLMFSGTVSPNISVSSGVTPRLTTATAITLD